MTTSTATPAIAATLDMVRNCILALRSECDGAASWDGAGFSKFDRQAGHDFADKIREGRNFSPKQFAYMASLCVKYRKQLSANVKEFDEAACKALIEAVKSGNFATPEAPAKKEAAPDPGKEFVATFGAFVKNSDSGKVTRINFGNSRFEWVPNSSIHPDDALALATRMPVEFRVHRWIFDEKRLPAAPRHQPGLARAAAAATATTSGGTMTGTIYRPATAPAPVKVHVIE